VRHNARKGVQNTHDWFLKHRIRTEWAKLDHAVVAAAVHQWRRLSVCVRAGGGHFEHCFWFPQCVCSDNCDLSCCRWPTEQLHANVSRFGLITVVSYDFVFCNNDKYAWKKTLLKCAKIYASQSCRFKDLRNPKSCHIFVPLYIF